MANNILTPAQLSSYAKPAPTAPSGNQNNGGLLTPAQLSSYASGSPANSATNVKTSWDAFDKSMTPETGGNIFEKAYGAYSDATKSAADGASNFWAGLAGVGHGLYQNIKGSVTGNQADQIAGGNEVASSALKVPTGLAATVGSPLTILMNMLSKIPTPSGTNAAGGQGSNIGESFQNTYIKPVGDFIGSNPQLQGLVTKYPNLVEDIPNMVNTIALLGGLHNEPEITNTVKNGFDKAGTVLTNAAGDIIDSTGKVITKASDLSSAVKNKIAPTPTLDQIVGKVAQGKTGDIPSFTKGLENIGDTSKVKTYADLNSASTKTITDLAKQQDANLAQDTTTHPMSEFEQTTGKGASAVKTNYVQQALTQLQDFYTKTNNAEGLSKVKALTDKANGEGLTVQEVNNLARMHGQDLNGFNANGELASGLTKQAAENTRVGLKNTVDDSIVDPTVRAQFRAIDSKMSDTFTVRDLSAKMAEKVNTLTQRLQQPTILQKIGSIVGKGMRLTGVGDLASKLLGLEKVPGASTLNAVDLEAKLSKNLAKISAALSKNDAGFVSDITNMINESKS